MPAITTPDFETNTQFPPHPLSITPRPSSAPTLEIVLGDITREATDAIDTALREYARLCATGSPR